MLQSLAVLSADDMTSRARMPVAVFVIAASSALGAQPAGRAQTEALSRRASDRLRALHDEADRLAADERTLLGELRRLQLDREIAAEEVLRTDGDAAALAQEFESLDAQVRALEEEERADTPRVRARLVSLYKLGRGRYLRLLLSATDVKSLGRASRMVVQLADLDRQRLAQYRERRVRLTASRTELDRRRAQLEAVRAEAERARLAADRAVAARDSRIREIDQQRDLNARLAGELLTAQQKLQATLGVLASESGAAPPAALPIGPFRGDLDWPVTGPVRQGFGRANGGMVRNGIDIASPEGEPVHAVHDGVIAFADAFEGFGRLIIVDHGNQAFSLYGNLADIGARRGARIQHGEQLGTAGTSATGVSGLYFELRIDGRPVDPLQWLKKR